MTERPLDVPSVLTIGHSTRTIEEFLGMLRSAGVTLLADVRRFPHSPRYPWFGEDLLPKGLREEGMGYAHLPGLGGRRRPLPDSPNAGWRNPSFRGYADHMETPEFRAAFDALLGLRERGRVVCLMCSEAVWWRCHRRMVADALVIGGIGVEHIMGGTRRQPHDLTPWAKVVDEAGYQRLVYPPQDHADAGDHTRASDA